MASNKEHCYPAEHTVLDIQSKEYKESDSTNNVDSVRKMQTQRPYTPLERNRILFSDRKRVQRPSSSVSVHSLCYDSSDKKPSLTGLESSFIQKAVITRSSGDSRHYSSMKTKHSNHQSSKSLPPIPVSSLKSTEKKEMQQTAWQLITDNRGRRFSEEDCNNIAKLPAAVSTSSPKPFKRPLLVRNRLTDLSRRDISLKDNISKRNEKQNNKNNLQVLSQALCPILDVLDNDSKIGDADIERTLSRLYSLLEEADVLGKQFPERCALLKILFKLLDYERPSLSAKASKIILGLKVTGKNLSNIFKLMYRISKNQNNDTVFLDSKLLAYYLEAVKSLDSYGDSDAVVYAIATIKFLAANPRILEELSSLGCVDILVFHLAAISNMIEGNKSTDSFSDILVQLITALRNLAELESNHKSFMKSESLLHLGNILGFCVEDASIVLPVMRTLSKLSVDSGVCSEVSANISCFPAFTKVLKVYRQNPDIVLRVCFVLGNMTAVNDKASLCLYEQHHFVEILVSILDYYVQLYSKCDSERSNTTCEDDALPDAEASKKISDIIVKVARVIANMCLNPYVGQQLAYEKSCIAGLTKTLDLYTSHKWIFLEETEIGINTLVTINNLTFYMAMGTEMAVWQMRIAERLFPLLTKGHLQVKIEACSIMGNLTRCSDVRMFLLERKLISLLMGLTEMEDTALTYISCGTMLNLLLDKSLRRKFYEEGGIAKLIDLLQHSVKFDWKLAGLICQVLWNYYSGDIPDEEINQNEMDCIVKLLHQCLERNAIILNGNSSMLHFWEIDFYPVAVRLWNHLNENKPQS